MMTRPRRRGRSNVVAASAVASCAAAAIAAIVVVGGGEIGAEASFLASNFIVDGPPSCPIRGGAGIAHGRPGALPTRRGFFPRSHHPHNMMIIDNYGYDGRRGGESKRWIHDSKSYDDAEDDESTAVDSKGDAEQVDPSSSLQRMIRLNKALSSTHSRRSADKLIAAGRVSVNGNVVTALGTKVDPINDVIHVDGDLVNVDVVVVVVDDAFGTTKHGLMGSSHTDRSDSMRRSDDRSRHDVPEEDESSSLRLSSSGRLHEYVKYWKPVGITCTCDTRVPGNLVEAMSSRRHDDVSRRGRDSGTHRSSSRRLFPVGRLDRDTSGLLLLTSDGRLPNSVLKSKSGQPKTYRVTLDHPMVESDLRQLEKGVVITTETSRRVREMTNPTTRGGAAASPAFSSYRRRALTARTLPARVERDGPNRILVTITEGRNRQVRKMVAAVGYRVLELHRMSFLGIGLDGLNKPGDFVHLADDELDIIHRAIRLHEEEEERRSSAARE